MKNRKFWLVMLLVFVMAVVEVEAQNSNGGEFTLTNIPAKYNGKYAFLRAIDYNAVVDGFYDGFFVFGCDDFSNGVPSQIAEGKVTMPLWITRDEITVQRYSGNHYLLVGIYILNSSDMSKVERELILEEISFVDLSDKNFKDKRKNIVKFTNGKATKSYNDRSRAE